MTELALANPWGGSSWWVDATTSTMDDARELERSGAPSGSLVAAGHQSHGVGRHTGRQWTAEPATSLLFTVFWNAAAFARPLFAPSLVVGLGVCRWLEALTWPEPVAVALKWPNDVYLNDAKVAGILLRARLGTQGPSSWHAGIGVNLAQTSFPEGFRSAPTSLALLGVRLAPLEALASLLPALARALEEPDPRAECERRLWRRGQEAAVQRPGDASPLTGRIVGLGEGGQLRMEGPAGPVLLDSGE